MTGYQEIITDPSYADQIITFTFPHIGNIGVNDNDLEHSRSFAKGIVIRASITDPSNYRASNHFREWLNSLGLIGIYGIDTRDLTKRIRTFGALNGVICHSNNKVFNIEKLIEQAKNYEGLEGKDLARAVTCDDIYSWSEGTWKFGNQNTSEAFQTMSVRTFHIVAIDYGVKKNILRNLVKNDCRVTVVPATTPAKTILALNPDGVFLSNGPGDPAATGEYAVPIIKTLIDSNTPIFGICLGHQLLGLSLGAKTEKMKVGHRGANHPVKDLLTGKIEITSQNHGFVLSEKSLPKNVEITHRSLFDNSIEGLRYKDRAIFSVQYHPEASPGPTESDYLFKKFITLVQEGITSHHA